MTKSKITVLVTVPVTVDLADWREAYGSDDTDAEVRNAVRDTVLGATEEALRLQANGAKIIDAEPPVRRYLISSRVTRSGRGWSSTRELPTFLLDSRIQGIVDTEHAERVARMMLRDAAGPTADIHVTATLEV